MVSFTPIGFKATVTLEVLVTSSIQTKSGVRFPKGAIAEEIIVGIVYINCL